MMMNDVLISKNLCTSFFFFLIFETVFLHSFFFWFLSCNQLFQTRLALNSQRFACICLPSAGIKCMCHHRPASLYFLCTVLPMQCLTCDKNKESFFVCKIYNKRLRFDARGRRRTCFAANSLSACIRILSLCTHFAFQTSHI